MSFMKAWEVVRTCVLSWRWRHLWASAPYVDAHLGRYNNLPGDLTKFVYRLLLARDALAPVDTLRLRSLAIMTILTWKMLRCGSVMRSNGMLVSSS
jgi:hypothetical protein